MRLDTLKLSQEQANLIKNDRDLAAFKIVLQDKYGEKFGNEETDMLKMWREDRADHEAYYIEEYHKAAYESLAKDQLSGSIKVLFCPKFEWTNEDDETKELRFDTDKATPKRSQYKIEECTEQEKALQYVQDVALGK